MKLIGYLKQKIPSEIKYILLLFFVTRIALTVIGVTSRLLLEPYHGQEYGWVYSEHLWLDIWGVWDTGWYLDIAENWYSMELLSDLPKYAGPNQANYGFFPLYPALMKGLGLLVGSNFIAGIIVSNIFLILQILILL